MEDIKFEDALSRLEFIVTTLEKGDIPLDESIKLFEEGISLSKKCNKIIKDAEKRVSILIEKNSVITEENFESI